MMKMHTLSLQLNIGITKRTPVSQFANIRTNGLIAIGLREDDELISVRLTDGKKASYYRYS